MNKKELEIMFGSLVKDGDVKRILPIKDPATMDRVIFVDKKTDKSVRDYVCTVRPMDAEWKENIRDRWWGREERCANPQGFHLFYVRDELIGEGTGDTLHNLIKQTYDCRYREPPAETFTVTLTAEDVAVLGRALEVLNDAFVSRHLEPAILNMAVKIGGKK